ILNERLSFIFPWSSLVMPLTQMKMLDFLDKDKLGCFIIPSINSKSSNDKKVILFHLKLLDFQCRRSIREIHVTFLIYNRIQFLDIAIRSCQIPHSLLA